MVNTTTLAWAGLAAACQLTTAALAIRWNGKAEAWRHAADLLARRLRPGTPPEARTNVAPAFHAPAAPARPGWRGW